MGDAAPGMTGWQIYETAERSLARFWNITRSQVYLELDRLEQDGLVAGTGAEGPRARQPYTITEAGRAARDKRLAPEGRGKRRWRCRWPDRLSC